MKQTKNILLLLLVSITLFSCIKEEPLNEEADIENATIENASSILLSSPIVGNNTVTFRLKQISDNMLFAPEFAISKGATISPASGTELDFIEPQEYTVTSEDGQWTKVYTVSFVLSGTTQLKYSFEDATVIETESPEGIYHQFFEFLPGLQTKSDWDSGNEGYNLLAATLVGAGEELSPSFYPTAQVENGYEGKGVVLQTKKTGMLGAMFGSPLAAGNLFIGHFNFTTPPIKSTRFGQPYTLDVAPIAVKGYFKYKAGQNFDVNTKPSELNRDSWDAYAKKKKKIEGENDYLEGDHNFEDPRMLSVARIDEAQRIETDEWTSFEMKFEFIEGKQFDLNKEYFYTIVFSSSYEGAIFNGAEGSKLYIDEIEIIVE